MGFYDTECQDSSGSVYTAIDGQLPSSNLVLASIWVTGGRVVVKPTATEGLFQFLRTRTRQPDSRGSRIRPCERGQGIRRDLSVIRLLTGFGRFPLGSPALR